MTVCRSGLTDELEKEKERERERVIERKREFLGLIRTTVKQISPGWDELIR